MVSHGPPDSRAYRLRFTDGHVQPILAEDVFAGMIQVAMALRTRREAVPGVNVLAVEEVPVERVALAPPVPHVTAPVNHVPAPAASTVHPLVARHLAEHDASFRRSEGRPAIIDRGPFRTAWDTPLDHCHGYGEDRHPARVMEYQVFRRDGVRYALAMCPFCASVNYGIVA
jgi:hypothetical protein